MKIEDIKNPKLKEQVSDANKNGSYTITADLDDALQDSNSDEELINNWQGRLMNLYNEIQGFWGTLENIKKEALAQTYEEDGAHETAAKLRREADELGKIIGRIAKGKEKEVTE